MARARESGYLAAGSRGHGGLTTVGHVQGVCLVYIVPDL